MFLFPYLLKSPIMDPLKIFAPSVETVVEGVSVNQLFLTEHPYDILREGRAHRVPLLTGVNSDEGLLATASELLHFLLFRANRKF